MKSCFYLLVFIASLFMTTQGKSQSLTDIRNRPYYTYVYRISAEQALQIARDECIKEKPEYFAHQVDSFLTDNGIPPSMPDGHYVFVSVNGDRYFYSLKYYGGLDAEIIPDNRQLMIRVMRNQQVVPDADVSLGGKQLKWRSDLNAYTRSGITRDGVIAVVQGGDTAVFMAENALYDPWKPLRKTAQIALYALYPLKIVYGVIFCPVYTFNYLRFHDNTRNNLHYGYSVTSQPMYRHGDTLQWKAYVVDRNGHPLKKKAVIRIYAINYTNKYEKEFVLRPSNPGSYSFEMPVTDSMQLDDYRIRFKMKRMLRTVDLFSLNKNFTVADYQLNELQGDFWTEKHSYYSGEPVTIFLKANDVLGFPARDARVSIIAATDTFCIDINKAIQTSYSQIFWSTDLTLNATDDNTVIIPGSALPERDVRVTLMVLFYNSNNESHRIIKMFDVKKTAPPFQYSVDANSLLFAPVVGSAKHVPVQIEAQNGAGKTLFVQSLQAPDTLHINALVNHYIASSGNFRDTILVSMLPDRVRIEPARTADSVFVKIQNPDQLPLHLVVYRNKKEIYAAHAGSDFSWSTAESSGEPYFISVSYYFGEEMRNQRLSLYAREKQLNVALNQPDAVLPGEEKTLTVRVTDNKNNPVENVNLTAFSVNSQFDRNNTASMPYLSESRKQKRKTDYTMHRASTTSSRNLNQYWLHKSGADTMLYYRFRYPQGGIACMYDSCLSDNAQFAPFIYSHGYMQKVYYIKLDDTLVFYDELNYQIPYSFVGSEGWHSMSIRTQKNLFELDSVYLKHGCKLNVCIHPDSVSALMTVSKERKVISKKEDLAFIKGCINAVQMRDYGWLWQGDRLFLMPEYSGTYRRNLVGPFSDNEPVQFTSYSDFYGTTHVDADSIKVFNFLLMASSTQDPNDVCKKQRLFTRCHYYDYEEPSFSDTAYSVRAMLDGKYDSMFVSKYRYNHDGCYHHNYEAAKLTILNDSSFAQFTDPGMAYNDYSHKPMKYRRGRWYYFESYRPGIFRPRPGHRYKLRNSRSFGFGNVSLNVDFNTEASYDDSSSTWTPDQEQGLDNTLPGSDSVLTAVTWSDVRSDFRDHAFWIPDLTTNAAGEATFRVTYPDNITRWSSYVYAMNNRGQSGIEFDQTNAFKLIFATLSMPRFLLMGDTADVAGKITNLSPDKHRVTSQFIVQGRETNVATDELDTYIKCEAQLVAGSQDSLKVRFGFSSPAIDDAEERTIPVFPVGVFESHGKFAALEGDTAFTWKFNPDSGVVKIYADGDYLRLMLEDLHWLRNYPYACNEQLASKLKALLMMKEIDRQTGKYFTGRQEIHKILKTLEKNKSTDNGYGWWPGGYDNTAITIYVADALNLAAKQDYQVDFRNNVLLHLQSILRRDIITDFEKLSIMRLFIESDNVYYKHFDYDTQLASINFLKLNTIEKLAYIRVKQLLHQEYQLSDVISAASRTTLGSMYWSGSRNELFSSDIQATTLAYTILKNDSAGQSYLPKVRGYFYELKQRGQWMNTIEAATVLYTILPDVLQQKNDLKNAGSIVINGTEITEFPNEQTASDNVVVQKTDQSPVFITAYQTTWTTRAEAVDKDFKVQTYFSNTSKNASTLKAAEPVLLIAEVQVKGPAQYVMIEIPVPAGCSYGNNLNRENKYEVHREYFKEKTSIFCEYLPAGTYRFEIELQPRYTGSYTLNPAKAELMYFPVFFGREGVKKIKIQ